MTPEHHLDHNQFCTTVSYQHWLKAWQPPSHAAHVRWIDHELEIFTKVPRLDHELEIFTKVPRAAGLTSWTTRMAFYLLDSLEIGDRSCVDVGCGENWFKRSYPSVWGVDPLLPQHRDEELTPEWWIPNWGKWHRAFAINSMHFCTVGDVAQQMGKMRGILAPGGKAIVTLNRQRIKDITPDYSETLLYDILCPLPGLTRMVWLDQPIDSCIDGNVWLWFTG
jgi:hypothetical protein